MFSEEHIQAFLPIVADTGLDLHAVDVGTLLGDDIHHSRQGHTAVERRGRTAQHLYLLDLLHTDAEVGCRDIGTVTVQPVAVEHDEDLLLAVAVDASHRDVDIVVTVYDVHAGHIGGEHLLQVLAPAVANHVLGDQGGGDWHLIERLCLAGGGGNLRGESQLDIFHHIDEPLWILRRGGVVGVLREQVPSPFLGLLVIVKS